MMISQKQACLLLSTMCLFLATGCNSLFKRGPAAAVGKHYIITLHGVRGNAVSFGDFHSLAKFHLEKVDPAYTVVPLNIIYTTGKTDFDPHTAALEVNKQLSEKIGAINPDDKISVLAYSMGGQVGAIWFYDSLKSDQYKQYALQTKKFISLGAPFWGSKEASVGANTENLYGQIPLEVVLDNALTKLKIKNTFMDTEKNRQKALAFITTTKNWINEYIGNYDLKVLPKSLISFKELKGLAMASDVANEIRMNHINFKTNTKWVSVSTLVSCFEPDLASQSPGCQEFQNNLFRKLNFDIFGKYAFGHARRETDNSVITPSANARFLYASEGNANYADGHQTTASQFRYSGSEENHKFYLAEGLHATVVPASLYGRAQKILGVGGEVWSQMAGDVVLVYEKNCKTVETCDHPSYKHIVRELADCDRENGSCDKQAEENIVQGLFKDKGTYDAKDQATLRSELHGFSLELNIRLPKGYDISGITHTNLFKYIKAQFDNDEEHSIKSSAFQPYKILLARPLELGSLTINKVNHYLNQEQLRIVMTGLIIPKTGQKHNSKALEGGASFDLDVNLPGLKTRKIQALVRPYYSTYVDLVLAK